METSQPRRTSELEDLITRLDVRADEGRARVTFYGRILGKADGDLHIAIPSGVVAVPIMEVEDECSQAFEPGSDTWWIMVRNGDRIRYLHRVEQHVEQQSLPRPPEASVEPSGDLSAAPLPLPGPVRFSKAYRDPVAAKCVEWSCSDSPTTTAGCAGDATDDYVCVTKEYPC